MKYLTLSILLSLLICTFATAQNPGLDSNRMDSLLMIIEKSDIGMGSVSIFKDGQEVYKNAFGFAVVEEELKPNPQTAYKIGSISKTFTAAIILQMVEEGKVSLSDKLYAFFPEIPNSRKITIEHLLRHQSGLYNFTSALDYLNWMENEKTRAEMIDLIKTYEVVFEPGSQSEYSNTNYVLLTYIAEILDEENYDKILAERITKPLELKRTFITESLTETENHALSYHMMSEWEKATETHPTIPMGAGALSSTPTEMNVFLYKLFQGKIISKELLKQATEIKGNFGMGLFVLPFYDKVSYGHTGGIDGFSTVFSYFPKEEVAISMVTNGMDGNMNELLIGVLSIYFEKEYELPNYTPSDPETEGDEELSKYLGLYSSPDFPLKVDISAKNNSLVARATGQGPINLDPKGEHKFTYEQAQLELEFLPEKNQMILRQAGMEFVLTREE